MYNRSAEPRYYTRVIEALPDKLDIKRHSPGILYIYHVICARYASKIWDFSKKTNIVIFLSSCVARQHRKERDDLIALLLYGFSNLRFYKHNISEAVVYKR